jgi:hypothetical protein
MPTVATMNQPYNLPPEQLFECSERFLPAKPDPQSCWIWRGANTGNGYGWLYIDGRRVRAHRFSYEIAHNVKLSPDVRALPCIESRLCVNPAHSTQQGERGRGHWSTLTINDVRMDIARRFGLSRSAVGNIVNRRGDWGRVE